MVRPCVARGFRRSVGFGSCINVSGLRLELCAPGHHGYQRACVLITGKASSGPFGSPVFACAGKTGPPSRLILSQTSAGNCGVTSWLAPYRCSSFVRAMRPFLRSLIAATNASVFSSFLGSFLLFDRAAGFLPPRPWISDAGARRGCQGRPSLRHRGMLRRFQAAPCTASSTAADWMIAGRKSARLSNLLPLVVARAD